MELTGGERTIMLLMSHQMFLLSHNPRHTFPYNINLYILIYEFNKETLFWVSRLITWSCMASIPQQTLPSLYTPEQSRVICEGSRVGTTWSRLHFYSKLIAPVIKSGIQHFIRNTNLDVYSKQIQSLQSFLHCHIMEIRIKSCLKNTKAIFERHLMVLALTTLLVC